MSLYLFGKSSALQHVKDDVTPHSRVGLLRPCNFALREGCVTKVAP
jgi:hypothetical protein